MSQRFANRVAVVTGAAGDQGRAVVGRLAAEGAVVLAIDLRFTAEQTSAFNASGKVHCLELSVAERDSVSAVRAVLSGLGRCDILYNNAGLYLAGRGDRPAGEIDLNAWDRTIAVNLTGAYLMIEAVLPMMIEGGYGVILNIASLAGVVGSSSVAYTASKAGLIGMTKSIASTHGRYGVRAVALSLGVVETSMSSYTKSTGTWDSTLSSIPAGRAAQPDEIAGWAAFLASPEAEYANGCNIIIDGGRGVGL